MRRRQEQETRRNGWSGAAAASDERFAVCDWRNPFQLQRFGIQAPDRSTGVATGHRYRSARIVNEFQGSQSVALHEHQAEPG